MKCGKTPFFYVGTTFTTGSGEIHLSAVKFVSHAFLFFLRDYIRLVVRSQSKKRNVLFFFTKKKNSFCEQLIGYTVTYDKGIDFFNTQNLIKQYSKALELYLA